MKKIGLKLVMALVVFSCQSQSNPKIKVLATEAFKTEILKEGIQLVDVRTAEEYASGAIFKAQNMDVLQPDFERKIQKLDKSKPVYIYCRSGSRSQTAGKRMVALGFTQVVDLKGGYLNWK